MKDFIIEVGCKRIVVIMVVGTWTLSQLIRIGAVIAFAFKGIPKETATLLINNIGVTPEFGILALVLGSTYVGYSIHKAGTDPKPSGTK